MELTLDELKDVVKHVLKGLKNERKDAKKGTGGYDQEDVQPRGFSEDAAHDFSKKTQEGSRYKRQGNSNMGPYTSESVVRQFIRNTIKESITMKPVVSSKAKMSAPFNQARVQIGENDKIPAWNSTKKGGSVWEDVRSWYMKESPKMKFKNKMESNILQGVYNARKK